MVASEKMRSTLFGGDTFFSMVMLLQLVLFGATTVVINGQNETDSSIPNTSCSVCISGEKMNNSTVIVPGGLVTFLPEPLACVRIELQAMSLQFTPSQCTELVESEIHALCGCEPSNADFAPTQAPVEQQSPTAAGGGNDTSTEFEVLKGRVFITLAPISNTMPDAVQIEYEAVLKSFFSKFFLNVQSIALIEQTLLNYSHSVRFLYSHPKRNLQGDPSTFSLQTYVQVEYDVSKDSELIGTNMFDQNLVDIINNNTNTLLNALTTLSYFSKVNYASGSLTSQSDTPNEEVPADNSNGGDDDLSIQAIVGIILGVIAGILAIPILFQLMCVVPVGRAVAPTNGSDKGDKEMSVSQPAKGV